MFRLLRPAAALAGGWIAATAIIGVATPTEFDGGRFFIDLIPAWPAYALLIAAIPALVPTLVARLGSRLEGEPQSTRVSRMMVIVLVLLVLVACLLTALIGR
jgi:Na+/proline symporter